LSHLLTHLRRWLPAPDLLQTEGEMVALDARRVWSDTAAFEQLCAGRRPADLRCAIGLYRAPFLLGFSLTATPEYDAWIASEGSAFERMYLEALAGLVEHETLGGDFSAAIGYARRYLDTDELAEAMHRRLMLLLALAGERGAALRQFERCVVVLERELGVGPLPLTRLAYQAILQGGEPDELRTFLAPARAPQGPATVPSHRRASSLPAALTPFIGRERELEAIQGQLRQARLLTLTGPGGSGKTRLALQAAGALASRFADGVVLVELAGLSVPGLVPQAIATALGLPERQGQSLLDSLIEHLAPRSLLLLLDTCEHLVAACAHLADALLRACPQLHVLATSREALGVGGETTWPVPGMATDNPDRIPEAVRLFADRAAAAASAFELTPKNTATVTDICRRLDGIPLAIELAAARARVLPVEAIAARLDDCFSLLTEGSRALLPRHQTLRATMDWSYALLPDAERRMLERLSVFSGTWTLPAAEAVVGDWAGESGRRAPPGDEVLAVLSQLVNKSLVVVERGQARYRLLETIRQYAAEKLAQAGADTAARDRHLAHYVGVAEAAAPGRIGPDQGARLARLEAEHDNLRAALEWAVSTDEAGECERLETGLRLAAALWPFWDVRCHLSEGLAWLERLLTQATQPSAARASVAAGAGRLALRLGHSAAARRYCEEAVALQQALGNQRGLAEALENFGWVMISQGRFGESQTALQQSLAISRQIGDAECTIYALLSLGEVARIQGDEAAADNLYQESLGMARELDHQIAVAVLVHNLGYIRLHAGQAEQAAALFSEGLAVSQALGRRNGMAYCLAGLGAVMLRRSQPARAVCLLGAARTLLDDVGDAMDPPDRVEFERQVAVARQQLGEAAFGLAWVEGTAMAGGPVEQTIAYALQAVRRPPALYSGGLTAREVEVLRLVAAGLTDAQVGAQLVISPRTVSTHLSSVYRKLDAASRAQAGQRARELGLL
jgi:non-specific serine/threonine protein kinase